MWFCHKHSDFDICFFLYRFDIYGLSPDADEDESGIKRASENSKFIQPFKTFLSF